MKYTYYYQTKDNENRTGEIKARDRADAYTQLRKQGIRPYRVVGDDPVNWRPWAIGGLVLVLLAGMTAFGISYFMGDAARHELIGRRQITGDAKYLMERAVDAWEGVFETHLDRYLAAYAQPGDGMIPLEASVDDLERFRKELDIPLSRSSRDRDEVVQLKDIVEKLREEMRAYLDNGGTVREYLDFLEERQQSERNIRHQEFLAVRKAPVERRHRVWLEANLRLKGMNLPPLPEPRLDQ